MKCWGVGGIRAAVSGQLCHSAGPIIPKNTVPKNAVPTTAVPAPVSSNPDHETYRVKLRSWSQCRFYSVAILAVLGRHVAFGIVNVVCRETSPCLQMRTPDSEVKDGSVHPLVNSLSKSRAAYGYPGYSFK